MSGHNKWAQIKHKKAITDSKKSKIFSKLVRFISVEAKLSGGKESPGLRSAIEKAKKVIAYMKSHNMPQNVLSLQTSIGFKLHELGVFQNKEQNLTFLKATI